MRNPILLLVILACTAAIGQNNTSSQPDWVKSMYSINADPAIVIKQYNQHYASHQFKKNQHTQYFKRWMRELTRSTVPNNYADLVAYEKNLQDYLIRSQLKLPTSTWQCIGPFDFDKEAESKSYACGAAHVYTVERSVSDTSVLYCGTATAGVWKTEDGGNNWVCTTNDMMVGSCRAIEIDFTNPDVAFFAAENNVYKTTNGGTSWNEIGDATFTTLNHNVNEIIIDPTNNNTILLAASTGYWHSADGGANWSQIMGGTFQEIEFHPTNASIVYFVRQTGDKTEFYRSNDGGLTLNLKTTGWPNPSSGDEQKRTEIAVSAAAPNYVYALATGVANGGSGLYGIYVSTDTAETWTFRCCGPQPAGAPDSLNMNLMGWSDKGLDDGGQFYYDLALDVSPTDSNKIHVGGVNHWISTDGGYNFTCPAKWSHSGKINYVHADIHDIGFFGNDLWIACDGGIFKSTDGGATINRKQFGIAGTDFWGFDAGFQDGQVMLGGTYHNGTLLKDGNTYTNGWLSTDGGDGIRGFTNPGNSRMCYSDYGGKILSGDRNVPIQNFGFDSLPTASYVVGVSSKMEWDPRNYNHIYIGKGPYLLKTENNGATYEIIHDFGADVTAIEVARTNPAVIYACTYPDWWGDKKVWKSVDSGTNWTEITPALSQLVSDEWVPFDIAVSSDDENTIWLARTSQYGNSPGLDAIQVFRSTDGGTNWTNYTTSTLDGEYSSAIVHQRGSDDGVYLGTRRAVYYRDNSMNDWALFNTGLPAKTACTNLVPNYGAGKIRNGSNRSVWEADFYINSRPQAQISANTFTVDCYNNQVQFADHSVLNDSNASWQWSFPGGSPSTSTDRNPLVTYSTPGMFDVSLTVTDMYGSDSQTYTGFITYIQPIATDTLKEDFEASFQANWHLNNDSATFNWKTIDVFYGPHCTPSHVATVNHFDINQVNHEAELITPSVDLSGSTSVELTLDYAYAHYGGIYTDGFRIDISTNCGATWDSLWGAFGDDLQTVPDNSNWWEPTDCADWDSLSFSLNAYIGQEIMIRFVAINGWGNNFYMDNINISGLATGIKDPQKAINATIFPNPTNGNFEIKTNLKAYTLEILSADGKLVYTKQNPTNDKVEIQLPSGIYFARITGKESVLTQRISILR